MYLDWPTDEDTQSAALRFPLRVNSTQPLPQYAGTTFNANNWTRRIRADDSFPGERMISSPGQIISEFEAEHYLPAFALVVSWGGMVRTASKIYGDHRPELIHEMLCECASDIKTTHSIETSWKRLTEQLNWSSVVISKTLHFLCRAVLKDDLHPPVAIDALIIRNRVWWCFRHGIQQKRPKDWEGNSFEAYCRYMTAIRTWADAKNWTTTQLEATIFAEYSD